MWPNWHSGVCTNLQPWPTLYGINLGMLSRADCVSSQMKDASRNQVKQSRLACLMDTWCWSWHKYTQHPLVDLRKLACIRKRGVVTYLSVQKMNTVADVARATYFTVPKNVAYIKKCTLRLKKLLIVVNKWKQIKCLVPSFRTIHSPEPNRHSLRQGWLSEALLESRVWGLWLLCSDDWA